MNNPLRHPSIGIVIPTLNAAKLLPTCLPPLIASPLKPRILIIDSSSTDDTVAVAKQYSVETMVIKRTDFNHGLTREMGRKHLNTDIVVMVTPDAIATDPHVLEKLIQPILAGKVSVAYARQIPHDSAEFLEAFPRHFNYPSTSHIRGIEDLSKYGVYTFFCSDSFAAYSSKAMDEIGGFQMVLLGEDTLATAQLLRRGHKIAYVAEAVVKHSHGYTLSQEFKRYFDTGIARSQYRDWISVGKSADSKRGASFAKALIKQLIKEEPALIPYALMQTGIKWIGYQLGRMSVNSPVWWKRKWSCQPSYWTSSAYLNSNPEKKL